MVSEKLKYLLLTIIGQIEEILDSCGNDAHDLDKPGFQIYCMLCRGGNFLAEAKKDYTKPKAYINFPNLYTRMYGCFQTETFIDCAYKAVYRKFKDTLFDLSDPGSANFVALQNTLNQLYRKGKPYC